MSITLLAKRGSQVLSLPLHRGEFVLGRSKQADLILPEEWTLLSAMHLTLTINTDERIFVCDGVAGKKSTNGTQLNRCYIPTDRWTDLRPGDELQIGTQLRNSVQISVQANDNTTIDSSKSCQRQWELRSNILTIGRDERCEIVLDGPTISRKHCKIYRSGRDIILMDNSRNGVFVNDKVVGSQVRLRDQDQIKVGTAVFNWESPFLTQETVGSRYRIDVRDLWLKGRVSGSNLSIEPGQLVAFVGGSGAGKSSLLTTIVGQNLNYQGQILINGNELKETYNSIKQEIGFVPQDDIVHLDLTVEEVLRYSARLKLPDIDQQRNAVERVLNELDIAHRRHALVSQLSGGQRKRVSIGVELIADPRILFLDEPTSGLDPGLDKRMMQLLRSFADSGRTIALVTHATNNVMLCDQVVFLGRGGYLCYAGPPGECQDHFNSSDDFSDIYQYLDRSTKEVAGIAESYKPLILQNLPSISHQPSKQSKEMVTRFASRPGLAFQQFCTLLSRDTTLTRRDRTSLLLNSITAPLAVVMIAFAANHRDIFSNLDSIDIKTYPAGLRILFVIVCATIWVGLSTSLQVLVKERSIFRRERAFNLLPESYLASKLVVLVFQAIVQSLLILFTISLFFDTPESTLISWPLAISIVCLATIITIGSQALLASSLAKNSQQASSIAPILLIPQLIFGGVLFTLNQPADRIYPLITSRWAMKAMGAFSSITDLIPGGSTGIEQFVGVNAYAATYGNLNHSLLVMSIQCIAFLLLTLSSLLFLRHNR